MPFATGYSPERAAKAKAEVVLSGRYATVTAGPNPTAARSLTSARLWHLEQNQAGTCWLHAAVQLAHVVATLRGLDAFPVCRRLVGYAGKRLEGGGNPSDGGSGMDALAAMCAEKGLGVAHEALWPYTDDYRSLAAKPPQAVLDDAKKSHLALPLVVDDLDQAAALIHADKPAPTCIGIWWTGQWDSSQTFMQSIGRGSYGHELLISGHAPAGTLNDHEWFQLDNWHGLLYPPLTADLAAKVDGYRPIGSDRTSDFWVRRDWLQHVMSFGGAELSSAMDLDGLGQGGIDRAFADAFPV